MDGARSELPVEATEGGAVEGSADTDSTRVSCDATEPAGLPRTTSVASAPCSPTTAFTNSGRRSASRAARSPRAAASDAGKLATTADADGGG